MDVADPKDLRETLRRHGVRAARGLGQRFLVDRSVLAAIITAAQCGPADHVLEVGPGPGALTRELAARAGSVTAVEVDPRMTAVLEETIRDYPNVRIVNADALEVDLYGLPPRAPTRIVANLPYQITTPLLERFLADPRRPPLVVVLVQREVATRICATPRAARERGFLSVFVQSFADPRIGLEMPLVDPVLIDRLVNTAAMHPTNEYIGYRTSDGRPAVLSPPDPFSMLAMMLPTMALYELSIWAVERVIARQAAAQAQAPSATT